MARSSGDENVVTNIGGDVDKISVKNTIYKEIQITVNNLLPEESKNSKHKLSHCCETYHEGSKECDVLKQKLQQLYARCTMPKVSWLNDELDFQIDEYFIQLHLIEFDDDKPKILLEDIFNTIDGNRPLRILTEAQQGFGKTTLATKLAHDWAASKKYINKFQFVFFVLLKELRQQQGIEYAIEELVSLCDFQVPVDFNVNHMLRHHEKDTLLILDGLDEVSEEVRNGVLKILYKRNFAKATVIVLCRSGTFALSKHDRSQLFGMLSNQQSKFHDKRIEILGIPLLKYKRDFLEKHISKEICEKVIRRILAQLPLFDSPLLLMILVLIVKEDENVGPFATITDLYKKMFNSIIQHSLTKRGESIDDDFDLFRLDSPLNKLQTIIYEFGKLSVEKILKKDYKFEKKTTQAVYEAGFLTNHKNVLTKKTEFFHEPFHLTFLEFAAAFYLWVELRTNKSDFIEKHMRSLVLHFSSTNATSKVLPFLASLMDDHLETLFRALEPFAHLFSVDLGLTVRLLQDCASENIINTSGLKLLIPSYVHLRSSLNIQFLSSFSQSQWYKLLINYGIDHDVIKNILTDDIFNDLFRDDISTTLVLRIKIKSVTFSVFSKSPCKKQFFHYPRFKRFHKPQNDKILSELVSYFALPSTKSVGFHYIEYDLPLLNDLYTMIANGNFPGNIKFHVFDIKLSCDFHVRVVKVLLENDQIQYLTLDVSHGDIQDLSLAAAKSSYLTAILISSICVTDEVLKNLTNGGIKKYDYISLRNCRFDSISSTFHGCCRYLSILFSVNDDTKAIAAVKPICLEYFNADGNPGGKVGLDSVGYLHLFGSGGISLLKNSLSSLKNLKTLVIDFTDMLSSPKCVLQCITLLRIKKLVIERVICSDLDLSNYLNHCQSLKMTDIIFEVGEMEPSISGISNVLLSAVKNDVLDRINFVTYFTREISLFASLIDTRDFNVNHYLYGSDVDDPEEYKRQYNNFYFAPLTFVVMHGLCVTRKRK